MGKKSSWKGKKQYPAYKSENRAYKNKIRKLERHCRLYPKDEDAQKALEKLRDPKNFKVRSRPLVVGSNPTTIRTTKVRSKYNPIPGFLHHPGPQTAGEQLSKLLGIPLKNYTRPRKPAKAPITYKKKKSVQKP